MNEIWRGERFRIAEELTSISSELRKTEKELRVVFSGIGTERVADCLLKEASFIEKVKKDLQGI